MLVLLQRTPRKNTTSMGGSRTSPWLANPQMSPSETLFPNMEMAKKEKIQKSSLLPEQHRDINGHREGFFVPITAFWPRCLGHRLMAHAGSFPAVACSAASFPPLLRLLYQAGLSRHKASPPLHSPVKRSVPSPIGAEGYGT